MKPSELAIFALASCVAWGCAEGYGLPEVERKENAALGGIGGFMQPTGGMSAGPGSGGGGSGGDGGEAPPLGDTCTRGDVMPCACEDGTLRGQRTCYFDMLSPTQGFFSDCEGCPVDEPPPDPATLCSDGEQGGAETDIDCGGSDCAPCLLGMLCLADNDCAVGMCSDGMCAMMPAAGSGGEGGASGEGGTGGMSSGGMGGDGGEEEPPPEEEPVRSCFGERAGTPCDRECLLPGNTARCSLLGICSCL